MVQVKELETLVFQMRELHIQLGMITEEKFCILHIYTIRQFITHLQIECENRTRDDLILGSKVNRVSATPDVGASFSGA